jgi:N-acetylglucosamine transport system substrate-binding protein
LPRLGKGAIFLQNETQGRKNETAMTEEAGMIQTRREMLKTMALVGGGLAATALSTSCSTSGNAPGSVAPTSLPTDAVTLKGDIAFQGFGDEIWKRAATRLKQEHPNITVDLNFAPDVWKSLQPKFATGNVPDVAYPGYEANIAQLANEGVLLDLAAYLDSPAFGVEGKKVRDLFVPGSLEYGTWNDKVYGLPLAEISWLLWYDAALFKEKGWTAPTHWDEFVALCQEIKGAGMTPIGNPGGNPGYWNECIHHGLLWKLGGKDFAVPADNLEPGVWKRPEVAEALNMQLDLVKKGFIRPESRGLNNTDNQVEWLRHKSAFVPAGTWLENEMAKETPKDFVMTGMPVPGVKGSNGGDASDVRTWFSELQIVPAKAKQPAAALEYFRIFFSPEFARIFAEVAKSPMPIVGRYEGVTLTPAMKSAMEVNDKAKAKFDFAQTLWYSKLRAEQPNPLSAFLYGDIDAAAYVEAMEELNTKIRDDATIKKYTRS